MKKPIDMKWQVAISLYSGKRYAPFFDIHEKAEELLGRPIYTHEFADKSIWEEIKTKLLEQAAPIK